MNFSSIKKGVKDKMKDKILDSMAFIVGVLTVILVALLNKNVMMMGIVGGMGAFFFGLINIMRKNNYGYVFTSCGLGCAISFLLYKYHILDRPDALMFMICSSTFLLMLISFIFDFINNKELFKIYNMEIIGVVVDLVKNPNTKQDYYQVIYEYEVDDKIYRVARPGFINKNIPNMGDKDKIYVDSQDYANVYFKKSKKERIIDLIIGGALMIASLGIMISLIFKI